MSEDVSSQIRVGITVILVAALVAGVLNLMVVAQSILGSGLSTLQSGVDQISMQEFENYNQKKVSGTQVKSALALYEGRDIAIVVRTNSCIDGTNGAPWAYNYGSLLEDSVADSGNDTGLVYKVTSELKKNTGETFYTKNLKLESGVIESNNNTKGTTATGDTEFILESARFRAELIKDDTSTIVGICFTQLK